MVVFSLMSKNVEHFRFPKLQDVYHGRDDFTQSFSNLNKHLQTIHCKTSQFTVAFLLVTDSGLSFWFRIWFSAFGHSVSCYQTRKRKKNHNVQLRNRIRSELRADDGTAEAAELAASLYMDRLFIYQVKRLKISVSRLDWRTSGEKKNPHSVLSHHWTVGPLSQVFTRWRWTTSTKSKLRSTVELRQRQTASREYRSGVPVLYRTY